MHKHGFIPLNPLKKWSCEISCNIGESQRFKEVRPKDCISILFHSYEILREYKARSKCWFVMARHWWRGILYFMSTGFLLGVIIKFLCLSFFSHCYDKMPRWKQLKGEWVFLPQQTLEAVAHTASTVTKQSGANACWRSAHFLHFMQSGIPAQGMALPTVEMGLPISVSIIKVSSTGMPRIPSPRWF